MLVDSVTLTIKAGDGGDGVATFSHTAMTSRGGPDGGNGGNGGCIYFQGSHDLTDLREFRFKKKILAANGVKGKHFKLHGKNAPDMTIFVPFGTRVLDTKSGDSCDFVDSTPYLIAKGGKGGRGNVEFKSAINQAPKEFEKGTQGEQKQLHLEMKLIAKIGLTGLPNAGKSTLLSLLTRATPKIANYPFTTLEPNIGMWGSHLIADIPGLIEGAAEGKGLGTKFLQHIEKTKVLIHCIDVTSEVGESYEIVRKEFEKHNPKLLTKPEIILLTKTDLVTKDVVNQAVAQLQKPGCQILTSSIHEPKSIELLKELLAHFLKQSEK